MAKAVAQFIFDVLYDDDGKFPEWPLEAVLDESCENMGYKLVGYGFYSDETDDYKESQPELFDEEC